MKSRLLLIGLVCAGASLARADFTPIPLDPTSFNQDPVIEKTAPKSIADSYTITMDQGTNKGGNTWYEMGYNVGSTTGFPLHNSLLKHTNSSTGNIYTFQMPADYHVNNCLFIGHNNSSWTPILGPGTLTLTTPAPFSTISVLNASGNGACTIAYTVHFANGTTQTGTFSSTDWWSGNADSSISRMWDAAGLLGSGGGVNNQSANHGVIWANDLPLNDTSDNVTSIDFQWISGSSNGQSPWGNGRTAIFGLAGSTDNVNFTPVAVSGYTQDAIMEADGPATTGISSYTGGATNNCTVTMDGALARTGNTWFEQGYYAAYPKSGIPAAGSTITSTNLPSVHYTMPASYATNCAYFLSVAVSNATVKFATPTAASALAFLGGGGNGGLNVRVELGFQGGGSETNFITVPDWFGQAGPRAWVSFGRVNPSALAFANTPDTFGNFLAVPVPAAYTAGAGPQPFYRDPRLNGQLNPNTPAPLLYDMVIPVSNSGSPISTINLICTNTSGGNSVAIFAVSGSPGMPPIFSMQPTAIVVDSASGTPLQTNSAAVANDIRYNKCYQGTNNLMLVTSNRVSSGVSYQWMKAPRGGGWRDIFDSYDMSTFANVTAPNVGGATSPVLVISNATLNDSGDYLVVASSSFGSQTSFVANVTVLNTNYSLLVGQANGDTITKWSSDANAGITGNEGFPSAIDQLLQKWLSTGVGGVAINGSAIPQNTVPFVGPVGYIVTPVAGPSYVNAIRFYTANDTPGRDPRDYLLEGSNDGSTWTTINGGQLIGTLMIPPARNGTGSQPLNPMTMTLTEVDFPNSTAYKEYRVSITNIIDFTDIALMQISEIQLIGTFVPAPPVWVLQPVPTVEAYVGSAPTLNVQATGLGALAPHYQWYQFGVGPIAGATSSAFTRTNVQFSDSGTGFYCTAQNNSGLISSSTAFFTVLAAPTNSYPTTVTADKPMSYWRLDEGPDNGQGNNGTIAYDYYGGHNGYYSNVVLRVPGYSSFDPDTAMQVGVAITPDSLVNNIFNVDFAMASGSGSAAFSVEAWAYGATPLVTTGAGSEPAIVAKGNYGGLNTGTGTGTEQFGLDYINTTTSSGFRFVVRDAIGQGYQAQSSVTASDPVFGMANWHHLVGVCDQAHGSNYLYVDGLLAAVGTISNTAGILTQPIPMTIGARRNSVSDDYDDQWPGTIDDVAVYPYTLSASQVMAHFLASQRPPIITGPYYLLLPIGGGTNWIAANNVPVTFQSSAYGPGTLHYQWWNSDNIQPTTPISGATSSNYTFTTTPAMNNNFYQLVVSNQYGAVTSAIINLTVQSGAPTFIVDLPASQNIFLGHIIQLGVNPGGTGPFTYQWQKNGVNISNDYRTSGAQGNPLTIGYANTNDTGSYQVMVTCSAGSAGSTIDAVSVITNSSAFFGATSDASAWALQGTTLPILYSTNAIQLTGGLGSTGRSAWLTTKQNIASFNATFFYQLVGGTGGQADGMTFCIQNESGTEFTGGTGGSMSYDGLTPSVALEFEIYNSNGRGIAFCQNGTRPASVSILPNVDVGGNANPISVNMIYNGTVLAITYKDTVTGLSVATNWTVNIPSVVGASTAWVGFTAADGGVSSTQLAWWSGGGAQTPASPIRMTTAKVGNNIVLSWPAKNGGYLETSPKIGSGAVWTYSTAPWQLIGDLTTGIQQVTIPIGAGSAYLRLQQLAP